MQQLSISYASLLLQQFHDLAGQALVALASTSSSFSFVSVGFDSKGGSTAALANYHKALRMSPSNKNAWRKSKIERRLP